MVAVFLGFSLEFHSTQCLDAGFQVSLLDCDWPVAVDDLNDLEVGVNFHFS
jgi:hypothetical protein